MHETYYSKEFLSLKKKKKLSQCMTLFMKNLINYTQIKIFLKKRIIDRSDAIICISNNTKNDLIKYYKVPENKIFVTYLGCDHFKI